MTGETAAGTPPGTARWAGRAGGWLRGSRGGLLAIALVVGAGSGLGAVAFRDLIYFFTWLATGHAQFGQQGRVGSAHLPWLGLGFFVVIPVIGGLIYGPLIYRYAREARGHGVPEVMIAVAEEGGRIRPQVAAVKSVASAHLHRGRRVGRPGGPDRADRLRAGLQPRPVGADAGEPAADPGRLRRRRRDRGDVQRADHRGVLRRGDHLAGVLRRGDLHRDAVGDDRRPGQPPVPGQCPVPVRAAARDRFASPEQLPAGRGAGGDRGAARAGVREDPLRDRGPVRPGLEATARSGPGPPSAGSRSGCCCSRSRRCTGSATRSCTRRSAAATRCGS